MNRLIVEINEHLLNYIAKTTEDLLDETAYNYIHNQLNMTRDIKAELDNLKTNLTNLEERLNEALKEINYRPYEDFWEGCKDTKPFRFPWEN